MSENVIVAIVSASGAVVVAIVSLIVNVVWMGRTFAQLDKRLDKVEHTLEVMQGDLKEFYKELTRIKAKIGMDLKHG